MISCYIPGSPKCKGIFRHFKHLLSAFQTPIPEVMAMPKKTPHLPWFYTHYSDCRAELGQSVLDYCCSSALWDQNQLCSAAESQTAPSNTPKWFFRGDLEIQDLDAALLMILHCFEIVFCDMGVMAGSGCSTRGRVQHLVPEIAFCRAK